MWTCRRQTQCKGGAICRHVSTRYWKTAAVCWSIAEAGLPALIIAPNANRGLKTMAAQRTLPLHPQLIELGLCDHAARQIARHGADGDLFPDLRPRTGTGFGEQLDYRFRALVQRQLTGDAEGKVFHSFRHYVATQLGSVPDMREAVRKDIMGHTGGSITAGRYTETTSLAVMAEAIRQLPWLPVAPPPLHAPR